MLLARSVHPPSFQTSGGKDLSNGSIPSWVSHNTSNTGSSKLLQQHASATAAALILDPTSWRTMSLMISSTLRQACIRSRRSVSRASMACRKTKAHSQCQRFLGGSQAVVESCGYSVRSRAGGVGQVKDARRSPSRSSRPVVSVQAQLLLLFVYRSIAELSQYSLSPHKRGSAGKTQRVRDTKDRVSTSS